jgi:malonyl-CoA O-methyltransferase
MLRRLLSRRAPGAVEMEPLPAYNLWAANYPAQAHNPLMQAEERAVLDLLPAAEVSGRRALDAACGTGRYLRWLVEAGASFAAGVDFSAEMLARAENSGGVLRGDMRALPLAAEAFDVVVCGLAVGHLPDLAAVVREMARLLRPGGLLVYSDFHPCAHLAGWKRAFQAEGRQIVVQHHLHLYADHQAACRDAGLTIEALREPCAVDENGRRAWGDIPAALAVRARKNGG